MLFLTMKTGMNLACQYKNFIMLAYNHASFLVHLVPYGQLIVLHTVSS